MTEIPGIRTSNYAALFISQDEPDIRKSYAMDLMMDIIDKDSEIKGASRKIALHVVLVICILLVER
jgi:hypothetical protein